MVVNRSPSHFPICDRLFLHSMPTSLTGRIYSMPQCPHAMTKPCKMWRLRVCLELRPPSHRATEIEFSALRVLHPTMLKLGQRITIPHGWLMTFILVSSNGTLPRYSAWFCLWSVKNGLSPINHPGFPSPPKSPFSFCNPDSWKRLQR